jgi:hypothetical protein
MFWPRRKHCLSISLGASSEEGAFRHLNYSTGSLDIERVLWAGLQFHPHPFGESEHASFQQQIVRLRALGNIERHRGPPGLISPNLVTTNWYELIGAGMLILAAGDRGLPMDYDELERWTRVGFERGSAMRRGER